MSDGWFIIRTAWHRIRKRPGPYASMVILAAFAVGINGAVFRVIDVLFLQPPAHLSHPEQLRCLKLWAQKPGQSPALVDRVSYPLLSRILRMQGLRVPVAGRYLGELAWGQGAESRSVRAALVTPDYFRVIGIRPWLGAPDLAGVWPGGQHVVLSYHFWQQTFGGDPAAVGSMCWVSDRQYRIAGVFPQGFRGIGLERVDL